MNKAKIMLATVSLLAVVGGALAFKTHRFGGPLLCKTTTASTVWCTIPATTTNIGPKSFMGFCTLAENVPPEGTTRCPLTYIVKTSL